MPTEFRIPKQTDQEIADALARVQEALRGRLNLKVILHIPFVGGIDHHQAVGPDKDVIDYHLSRNSQTVPLLRLQDPNGQEAASIYRQYGETTDRATLADGWHGQINDAHKRASIHAEFLALLRTELKAPDIEAVFRDAKEDSWSRYRNAQVAVVNSLQQATETLLVEASRKNAELDKSRSERFEKLERELREQLTEERKSLQELHDERTGALLAKEKALVTREASFETKESHYVARQKQAEQIKQVQEWLKKWDLTEGTRLKRRPVMWLYVSATATTGLLTLAAVVHSFNILDTADSIAKLAWWQWAMLWVKTALPLGAFVTFLVYFIRWYGDWARQHSEEEFRNRTLLVDIGRASWLLEAVRDSQERDKEIPKELLHELSRDLFCHSSKAANDIHPQALSDLLLQGLSSIRLKAADGSEVEATRGNKR